MPDSGRNRRADAVRNRARVLTSAARLLSENTEASFTAIAADAGVGVGTVYRHFPSRIALVEAVYRNELDAVCDAASELAAVHPPTTALRLWLDRFADYLATKVGIGPALNAAIAAGAQPFLHSRGQLDTAIELLLSDLRDAGLLRAGVRADDLLLFAGGVAVASASATDHEQRERILSLVMIAVTNGGIVCPPSADGENYSPGVTPRG